MEIRVTFVDGKNFGGRRHFCNELRRVVAFEAGGVRPDAPFYCPLCGSLTSTDGPRAHDGFDERLPRADMSLCAHGQPDAPCGDLVAGAFAEYDLRFQWGIPEYRAARLAHQLGWRGALWRWARPCPICRREFLAAHYGIIEHELRRLCEALSNKSQEARTVLEAIQADINVAHALFRDLDAYEKDAAQTLGDGRVGYVYAITDGTAIKIGWSARHPSLSGGRMAQLQTAHPEELRLVGAFLGSQEHEAELHGKFAAHRIRGEWFRYVPQIVEYFDQR